MTEKSNRRRLPHRIGLLFSETSNEIELTLTGSLRNLLGPLHCVGGEFSMLGPATFSGRDSWPNAEPGDNDWFDLRKTGKTRLWRDDYYCIPFGLMEAPVLVTESF